jgi:PleD family two-component response regulator
MAAADKALYAAKAQGRNRSMVAGQAGDEDIATGA